MKKVLTVGTIAALIVMIVTALSGHDTGFSLFMNTSPEHTIARVVLMISLFAIARTVRPRSRLFRTALGVVATLLIGFTVIQTFNYSLGLLDTVVYFLGGLLISIESLESEDDDETESAPLHQIARI